MKITDLVKGLDKYKSINAELSEEELCIMKENINMALDKIRKENVEIEKIGFDKFGLQSGDETMHYFVEGYKEGSKSK